MNDVFTIEGKCYSKEILTASLLLEDLKLYINIPAWIEERNVYDSNKNQIAVIKPKKYGGLSYYIYDIEDEFAKIKTVNYGMCYVKITSSLTISNKPQYESGCY